MFVPVNLIIAGILSVKAISKFLTPRISKNGTFIIISKLIYLGAQTKYQFQLTNNALIAVSLRSVSSLLYQIS
jgi:hypothetical protein